MHENEPIQGLEEDTEVFDSDEALQGILILLARIYDLQLAMLTVADETRANQAYQLHEEGKLAGPDVWISGQP